MLRSEFAAKLEMTIGYLFIRGVTYYDMFRVGDLFILLFNADEWVVVDLKRRYRNSLKEWCASVLWISSASIESLISLGQSGLLLRHLGQNRLHRPIVNLQIRKKMDLRLQAAHRQNRLSHQKTVNRVLKMRRRIKRARRRLKTKNNWQSLTNRRRCLDSLWQRFKCFIRFFYYIIFLMLDFVVHFCWYDTRQSVMSSRAVNEYSDIRISDGSEIFGFEKEKTNIQSQK